MNETLISDERLALWSQVAAANGGAEYAAKTFAIELRRLRDENKRLRSLIRTELKLTEKILDNSD